MVKGMTITDEGKPQLCDPCIMGKMTRTNFPTVKERPTSEVLDLVAMDVIGPVEGFKYVLVIKDVISKCTMDYMMKKKDEVFYHLKALCDIGRGNNGKESKRFSDG
jgi:hypothetical protein